MQSIGQAMGSVYALIDQLEIEDTDSDELMPSAQDLAASAVAITTDLKSRINSSASLPADMVDAMSGIVDALSSMQVDCCDVQFSW
jgi:ABC-type transporter Mla subunit MlaD